MIDPKLQIYGRTGKLVAADEDERKEWAKIGVRKLIRATKLTQKVIYSILSGKGVRKRTMAVFRIGVDSLQVSEFVAGLVLISLLIGSVTRKLSA